MLSRLRRRAARAALLAASLALPALVCLTPGCGGPPRAPEAPAIPDAAPPAPAIDAGPAEDAAPSVAWQDVELAACGVRAKMIGPAKETSQTIATDSGPAKMTILMYDAPGGRTAMGLTCSEKAQFKTSKASDEHQLDGSRDGMVKNVHGTLVSEKPFTFAGYPAREVLIRTTRADADGGAASEEVTARIVLMRKKGRMLTQIAVNVPTADARRFLDSLAPASP